MIIELIETAMEKAAIGLYRVLYVSLEPNDYLQLGKELREMSGKKVFAQIERFHNIPVYMDVTQKSHLVLTVVNYIERMFLREKQRGKKELLSKSLKLKITVSFLLSLILNWSFVLLTVIILTK